MIIDMSNKKSSQETLEKLTGISIDRINEYKEKCDKIQDLHNNDYYRYYNNIYYFLDCFPEVNLDNLSLENMKIKGFHCTTSSECCKDIKKNGLIGMKDTLEKDTELKRFLKENGIEINTKDMSILFNGEKKVIKAKSRLCYRINSDSEVNVFFRREGYNGYSCIYSYPEILLDIDSELNLEEKLVRKWEHRENKKTYLISTIVPIEKFIAINLLSGKDKEENKELIEEIKKYTYFNELKGNKSLEDYIKKGVLEKLIYASYENESINFPLIGFIDKYQGISIEEIENIEEIKY